MNTDDLKRLREELRQERQNYDLALAHLAEAISAIDVLLSANSGVRPGAGDMSDSKAAEYVDAFVLSRYAAGPSASTQQPTSLAASAQGSEENAPGAGPHGPYTMEYRSRLVVGAARHLGAVIHAETHPAIRQTFDVQFGPQFFPLPAGRLVAHPEWEWRNDFVEAQVPINTEAALKLYELRTRQYRALYLLTGPNSNSGLRDTVQDCGLTLPPLKTNLAWFWGLTTDPGPDESGH